MVCQPAFRQNARSYNRLMNKRLPAAIIALSFSLWAQTIEPPVVKTQTQPEYPPELRYYLTDHAIVQLSIDEDGVPFALQSTMQIPDNVVRAIRRWRFEPAHRGAGPVAVAMSVAVPIRRPLSEAMALRRRWTSTERNRQGLQDRERSGRIGVWRPLRQKIAQNPGDLTSRLARFATPCGTILLRTQRSACIMFAGSRR